MFAVHKHYIQPVGLIRVHAHHISFVFNPYPFSASPVSLSLVSLYLPEIYAVEHYSAVKQTKLLLYFGVTFNNMNESNIILSKPDQTKKGIYLIMLCVVNPFISKIQWC